MEELRELFHAISARNYMNYSLFSFCRRALGLKNANCDDAGDKKCSTIRILSYGLLFQTFATFKLCNMHLCLNSVG